MDPREFALPRLRAIRKAAVVVVEVISTYKLTDDYLDPHSEQAAIVRSVMWGPLRNLQLALEELQSGETKETVTKQKDAGSGVECTEIKAPRLKPAMATADSDGRPFFPPPDSVHAELIQATAAWDFIFSAWNALMWSGWTGETQGRPSKIEAEVVDRLQRGIRLLDQFDGEQDSGKPDKAPAVEEQGDENREVPDPDETLVRNLRGKQRPILVYLWKRGNVTRDQLRNAVWDKQKISDKGIDKAIERLNVRLYELKHSLTNVESSGGMFYLKHPQK